MKRFKQFNEAAPKLVNLDRMSPNGQSAPITGLTVAKARMFIAMSLADNGACSRKEAQTFAATVPTDGTVVTHASGRSYRISPA